MSVEHIHTSELCNKCVMWAWSRKEKNVKFTKEAEKAILKNAIELSEKYSDTIPLVQGSVQRIKIAKMAVAVACRLFSTEDGVNVVVKEEHVEFVVNFIQELYDSTFFGYKDYSKSRQEEQEVTESDKVTVAINEFVNVDNFLSKMLSTNMMLFDDIVDFTGLPTDKAKIFKQLLVANNCIKRRKNFFVKTPEFIKMLKAIIKKRREK